MKYAIVKSGGKQYKVVEGQEVLVDRLALETNSNYSFPEILFVRNNDEILVGNPVVESYMVNGKILGEMKGEKIRVSKFKAKVRYRRTTGFRPQYSKILIEKIEKGSPKIEKKEIKVVKKVTKKVK
jgi:large subunit ribosomal protein L21